MDRSGDQRRLGKRGRGMGTNGTSRQRGTGGRQIRSQAGALRALNDAWPHIVRECRAVLGSELHYQAMIYHCLRQYGRVPIRQVGMNVKQYVETPQTPLGKKISGNRHRDFKGFEPIPDVVIFTPEIKGDWRRRNRMLTLRHMVMAIEVKASEREKDKLQPQEIIADIEKLEAHHGEARIRNARYNGGDFLRVVMIVDTAPKPEERMTERGLSEVVEAGRENDVLVYYLSPDASSPHRGRQ